MQLTCQHCGTTVPAENINIQRMTAVCPACSHLFEVELTPKTKNTLKRRKLKRPAPITLNETRHGFNLSFYTNFRLHQNQTFLMTGYIGLVMAFLTVFMIGQNMPLIIFAAFISVVLAAFYQLALIAFNKTHIHVEDDTIVVSRKPLPALWQEANQFNVSGIENIRYAETPVSIREGYDLPRYNVWAEMVDGTRKMIIVDVIDDYAAFITQELNDYLNLIEDVPLSHLFDDTPDDTQADNDVLAQTIRGE